MKTLCLKNNIKLVVTYVPSEAEVLIQSDRPAKIITDEVKSHCAGQSIEYLDVTEKLRTAENPAELYFDDCHLSVEGNKIVADAFTTFFLNE
jgi:hypothetical protein